MKYLAPILAGTTLALLGGVLSVGAAETIGEYTPLAPLPGTLIDGTTATNLPTYLAGMMKLLIAVAGSLAFLMMVIGGTEYVAAGITPDAKGHAKEKITNAIIGLILTLVSYLILLSINPRLVEFNLELPAIVPKSEAILENNVSGSPAGPGGLGDSAIRLRIISGGNDKITFNRDNVECAEIGQKNCTTVYGLGEQAIKGVINLAAYCTGCKIVITGGTEYWNHSEGTAHKPGGNVLDLSKNDTALNTHITKNGLATNQTGCAKGKHYEVTDQATGDKIVYVDEETAGTNNAPHWHVCFSRQ
ncbi:MAG: hypothetical protein AAB552_02620 [Patescibacteria group bacterium]